MINLNLSRKLEKSYSLQLVKDLQMSKYNILKYVNKIMQQSYILISFHVTYLLQCYIVVMKV